MHRKKIWMLLLSFYLMTSPLHINAETHLGDYGEELDYGEEDTDETDYIETDGIDYDEYVYEEYKPYSVTIKADIPNGITDNITAFLIRTDVADDNDYGEIFLYRVNGFKTRCQLPAGEYKLTDIKTYSDYKIEDISFTVNKDDSASAQVVSIKVGEGSKGEEVNRNLMEPKGEEYEQDEELSIPIKKQVWEEYNENKQKEEDTTEEEPVKKEKPFYIKYIKYAIVGAVIALFVLAYKKLKKMYES